MKTLRAYIIARVLLMFPMLLILVTFVFFVVHLMPGDPVEAMIGQNVPQEYKDQIKHNLGLDRPLFLNFRGSRAWVKTDTLFLQTKPGVGDQALRVERGSVLMVSNRERGDGSTEFTQASDWLQVAVPEDFVGWVSPDQAAWMRRISMDMTVLEEKVLEGAKTWTGFAVPDGPTGDQVNAIWGERSGQLWFGTDKGVSRYDATGWEFFEETAGQDIQVVWSGQPAEYWFGTEEAGVFHLKGNKWMTFTTADGLASNLVFAIWGKSSKAVWVGTNRGANLYDGSTWVTFTQADGLAGQQVRAIWSDDKTFWFGTEGGLSRFDGQTWTTFTTADGLSSNEVRALWGDNGGMLWVGTEGGLSRFDGQTWTTFTAADGLSSNEVRALWGDSRGMLWVGTEGGLSRFDGRPWIKMIVPKGGIEGWAPADQFEIEINPFDSQYFNYLWGLVRLDLGESLAPTRGRSVIKDLKLKFPATLELAIASLTIAMFIGVSTGAFAARKRRSLADYGFRIFSIVIWAVPVFWLGLMFQLILGVYFGNWYQRSEIGRVLLQPIFGTFLPLPISGRIGTELAPRTITGLYLVDSILTANWEAFRSTIRHLILPALSLGLYLSGVFTRLTRSNMLDVLCQDYITAARARGIKERTIVYQHALKNAFIPILTMMGLQFSVLLAGAILTETTFSWPGMGLFMWERISYRDFNSIQGSVAFFAVLVAAVSLTVDIIYAWIDPRIRY